MSDKSKENNLAVLDRRSEYQIGSVLEEVRNSNAESNLDLIKKAYDWAHRAHEGQLRKSGDPYISHPVSVAKILTSFSSDEVSIAAALLHDVVEDSNVSLKDISENFSKEVADIVNSLTKLDKMSFATSEEAEAASMKKMMEAGAQDIRVLVIKLADRLHNMRTLAALPSQKRERIAKETLDLYAPLSTRLGMHELSSELEDLAFSALHPKWYGEIDQLVSSRSPEREIYLTQVAAEIESLLETNGIPAEVNGRTKHYWSIYKKMLNGKDFNRIYDLIGIRVVVESVLDCYSALGIIHSNMNLVHGRFKDYIATPKFNLYQSLHTTVIGPGGKMLEIQIRTQDMHDRSEKGFAAHWEYKEQDQDRGQDWLKRVSDWTLDPKETVESLSSDLKGDEEIVAFTPKGDLLVLQSNSTPVDFAYAIHTEVGNACTGAKVDGRFVPLNYKLKSGEMVEIVTSPDSQPAREWLDFAASQKARSQIRQWHSRETNSEEQVEQIFSFLVSLEGEKDMPIKMAECCQPQPPDEIFGLLNEGGEVVVHLIDCTAAALVSFSRDSIGAEWLTTTPALGQRMEIEVKALDRENLLMDVMAKLSNHKINTEKAELDASTGPICVMRFVFLLGEGEQVKSVLRSLLKVESVYSARRSDGNRKQEQDPDKTQG